MTLMAPPLKRLQSDSVVTAGLVESNGNVCPDLRNVRRLLPECRITSDRYEYMTVFYVSYIYLN